TSLVTGLVALGRLQLCHDRGRPRTAAHVKLGQEVRDVGLHRLLGQEQALAALAVRQPLADQPEDLAILPLPRDHGIPSGPPFPAGSRTSSTATSGRAAGMRASACSALPASPTISMSDSDDSKAATPRRTTSWSSTKNTRMVMNASLPLAVRRPEHRAPRRDR